MERNHQLSIIQALLYGADKPIELEVLTRACKSNSPELVKELIDELSSRLESISSPLQVLKTKNERYILQLRPEFNEVVRKYVKRPLTTRAILKTLAFIAYHQPTLQSNVVHARGKEAYRHVRQLTERGLIELQQAGKTKIIKTTQIFADYFGIENDPRIIRRIIKTQIMADSSQYEGKINFQEVNPDVVDSNDDLAQRPGEEKEDGRKEDLLQGEGQKGEGERTG